MKILAIETSGHACGAAVAEDGRIVSEIYLDDSFTHSTKLMPMVDEALKLAGTDISEIELFAVTTGPGSFTGLRIGLCTVKGMAQALDKKIAANTSLEVLAKASAADDVTVMVDARNENVYAARYVGGKLFAESTGRYDDMIKTLGASEKMVFAGDGAENLREKIKEIIPGAVFAGNAFKYPRAGISAVLAFEKYEKGETVSPDELEANYMRPSQADRLKNRD